MNGLKGMERKFISNISSINITINYGINSGI